MLSQIMSLLICQKFNQHKNFMQEVHEIYRQQVSSVKHVSLESDEGFFVSCSPQDGIKTLSAIFNHYSSFSVKCLKLQMPSLRGRVAEMCRFLCVFYDVTCILCKTMNQ